MGIGQTIAKTILDEAGNIIKPFGHTIESEALVRGVGESTTSSLKQLSILGRRLGQSGRAFLNLEGPTAVEQAGLMDKVTEAADLRASGSAQQWDNTLDRLFPRGASKADVEHISDVAEGLVVPKTQAHLDAANEWHNIMQGYSDDALELGLDEQVGGVWHKVYQEAMAKPVVDPTTNTVRQRTEAEARAMATKAASRPYQPREFYVPHYYTPGSIRELESNPAKMEKAIDLVIKRGFADDRDMGKKIVQMYLRQPGEFRGGPLQHSRELDGIIDGGYDKDLRKVGARYFATASKRLETARVFGAKDELATSLFQKIASEKGNAKVANNLYLAFADSANPEFRALARLVAPIHAITLLSTAGIVQPSQISNIVARVGWTRTLRAMAETMLDWKKSSKWGEHVGATLHTIASDMSIDSPSGVSAMWSKMIGLEQLDRYNRVVAAVAGRLYATDLAKDLAGGGLKGFRLKHNLRMLDKLGIQGSQVIDQAGQLTEEQTRRAGYRLAKNTQFATEVLDMPEFRNQPLGRFTFLFKSFAFQQAKFIKDEVLFEAMKHGNFAPLLNYWGSVGPTAFLIAPLVRDIKGRKPPQNDDKYVEGGLRMIEDLATAGAFGMYWDAARALNNGPGAIVNWATGPTISEGLQFVSSDVAGVGRGIARGEGPDFEPAIKHLVGRAPLVGQYIKNTWWPQP